MFCRLRVDSRRREKRDHDLNTYYLQLCNYAHNSSSLSRSLYLQFNSINGISVTRVDANLS